MLSTVPDCRPLLAGPDDLTLVFQPVVELASGEVAGYEALSRFPGTAAPDVWFAAARQAGIAAELEALVVLKALAALDDLPAGTFLSVNVAPSLLSTPSVSRALAARPSLDRLVVEFTEHAPLPDLAELRRAVEGVKAQIRAEVPPEKQAAALERVDEIERAVVAEEPDLTTLQYVRNWFANNLPKLAGAVTGLVVHPVVGKVVEAAGDLAASQFRRLFGDATES